MHSDRCSERVTVTYRGYLQKSVLFLVNMTRFDPVHMQMLLAPSQEEVQSLDASLLYHSRSRKILRRAFL